MLHPRTAEKARRGIGDELPRHSAVRATSGLWRNVRRPRRRRILSKLSAGALYKFTAVAIGALGRQNRLIMKIRLHGTFAKAFWAGIAAPTALYAAPPTYPVFVAANSVPRAFADVGANLTGAASRYRDEASRKRSTP
jgi:hypothetical protein